MASLKVRISPAGLGPTSAHPIKGGGGVVEGHSKASGLGEVLDLMHAPTNFPLSPNIYIIAKTKVPRLFTSIGTYMFCVV